MQGWECTLQKGETTCSFHYSLPGKKSQEKRRILTEPWWPRSEHRDARKDPGVTTLGCTGWERLSGGLFPCGFGRSCSWLGPRNRHQGKDFWGQRHLTCPSSPLKPLPATGRGLSPSPGSTGETPRALLAQLAASAHFSPSPAHRCWVPAHPDALNQQGKKIPQAGSKQEPETVFYMQVSAPSPILGTQQGLLCCSCRDDMALSAKTLLKIGQGASRARNGRKPGQRAQNHWLNNSHQRGRPWVPRCQPPRRPPCLSKPLRTPGSDRLQQPREVDAEQGRVPAAGTAARQGGFRCRCRARSSHLWPRPWGRKAFTCQDGLNPARSYACSRAMARHWAALPGLTARGQAEGGCSPVAVRWGRAPPRSN